MRFKIVTENGGVVLEPDGDLVAGYPVNSFADILADLFETSVSRVKISLAHVQNIDKVGLQAFRDAVLSAMAYDPPIDFRVVKPSETLRQLLIGHNLRHILEIEGSSTHSSGANGNSNQDGESWSQL